MVASFVGGALLTVVLCLLFDHFSGFRHLRNHPMSSLMVGLGEADKAAAEEDMEQLTAWVQGLRFKFPVTVIYQEPGGQTHTLRDEGVGPPASFLFQQSLGQKKWIHHIVDGEIQFSHPLSNGGILAGRMASPGPMVEVSWSRAFPYFLLGIAAVLTLSGLLGSRLARRMSAPLARLAQDTNRLVDGRYSYSPCHDSPAEVQQLSQALQQMSLELEDKIESLAEAKREAELAERSRREFLGDISHSLGTPLTSIHGWLEAMRHRLVPREEMPHHLDKLIRQVEYVSQASRRLLELSLWESVEPPTAFTDCSLLECVLDVAETLEDELLEANIHLDIDRLSPLDTVLADRTHLREIFQVFFENAVHHSGGNCRLVVETEQIQGRLQIRVFDTGRGMTPEQASQALGRYYSRRGSGLGLAIAKRLVQAQGGQLQLTAAPGQGVRFEFELCPTSRAQNPRVPVAV